jgi:sugar transferase (PEP-CTERM system associated)
VIALAAVEYAAFFLGVHLAALTRFGGQLRPEHSPISDLPTTAAIYALITTVTFFSFGLYTSRQRARAIGLGLRMLMAVWAAAGVMSAVIYFVPTFEMGRGVLLITTGYAFVISLLTRSVFARIVDADLLKRRVLIFGDSSRLRPFLLLRRRSDRRGFAMLGFVSNSADDTGDLGLDMLAAPDGLRALCEKLDVDEVVVALQDRRGSLPSDELLSCRLAGVNVVDLATFLERETGRIHLDLLNPSWIIFNGGFSRSGMRLFTSRVLDFVASAALVALTLPIMGLTALAIWLEDGRRGGTIFYRQERVGYEGRIFGLLKFRSMKVDAEVAGKPQWASKNDTRVTRVGAFIRRARIDELPQLLNVLQGHMSFVGPRPERPQFVEQLQSSIPYYAYRHAVKPGITGWAQLCYPYGASMDDAAAKLQYDLYYIKNNSLLFDLGILVQTAEVVFMGKGAR